MIQILYAIIVVKYRDCGRRLRYAHFRLSIVFIIIVATFYLNLIEVMTQFCSDPTLLTANANVTLRPFSDQKHCLYQSVLVVYECCVQSLEETCLAPSSLSDFKAPAFMYSNT